MINFRNTFFGSAAALLLLAVPAHAKRVCSDLDGDGKAETCVEIDDDADKDNLPDDVHKPGEAPPTVPPVGPSGPVN